MDRKALLRHMASLATDADATPDAAAVFLPLTQHRLALRPDVVVIEGMRGAGKTALFRLVNQLDDRVPKFFEDGAIPPAVWIDGFSEEKLHPAPAVVDQFVGALPVARDSQLRAFWAVHLLHCLTRAGVPKATLPPPLAGLLRERGHDIGAWSLAGEQAIGQVMSLLDQIDDAVGASGRFVFVTYDYLDRLGLLDVSRVTRTRLVRALVALWLSNSTRLRAIRGKIFLRPDLFEEAERSFPDASKLRPRSVSLDWDTEALYRLLLRHLANAGPHVLEFRQWLLKAGVRLMKHGATEEFGVIPGPMGVEEQARFAAELAGEVMGSGAKKGYTHRWIPARLKDAGGRVAPRSILRLIGYAAKGALREPPGGGPLMHPTSLVGAMPDVSRDRVNELREEYSFVDRLSNLDGETMLMERRRVVSLLSNPTTGTDTFGDDGASVLDELERIGVIQVRADGRIDVPDIYRYGYGIKRKGGAAGAR
ncbi:MAG: hypothetical protein U0353_15800 [Sandaracinus sp.]